MNLPALDITGLLRKYGLRPDKSLGQNFLIDPAALRKVAAAAEVGKDDAVLEIGPGLGSLTRYLAEAARKVVAVELDADLLPPLEEVLAPYKNVQVVHGDILDLDPAGLMSEAVQNQPESGYIAAANIPYYITSALLRHLLEARLKPRRLTLTVQREVADRISAGPGDMSLLALSVQVYGKPFTAAHIPAGSFYPVPKVDSAVVRVDLYPQPRVPESHLRSFFRLTKAGFSQKRKTLRNALAGGLAWPKEKVEAFLTSAGVDPSRRAETLSLEEWAALTASFQQE
jgi:16S rRNA (adenine1518-N6/adenine1519-N6)-dimethyltransferase